MSDEEQEVNPAEPETQPVDTQSSAPNDAAGPQPSDEELFLAALNGNLTVGEEDYSFAPIKRGQTIKGTVAGKSDTEILVDVGVKSEGIIVGRELEDLDAETRQSLRVGEEIMVYVLAPEDSSGHVQLSLKRALEAKDWEEAEDYMKGAKLYESKVVGFNKGGLIVRFGKLRGFVPASQVSRERQIRMVGETPEQRWGGMVGEDIAVKVIEVDRGRKRLILSERAASKELRAQKRSDLLNTLAVGQIHTGRVISLTDFGAFIDLGGADGLIHLSELSWEHVKHPKEVLKVGDEVTVEIINIDPEKQRIGLSRKKLLDDPWIAIASEFKPGQLVQGTITKLTKFGAFARLVERPEIEGLIHISELSDKRVTQAREIVEEGQVVTVRVLNVDIERRRLGLSLKRALSEEYMDSDWRDVMEAANQDQPKSVEEPAPPPQSDEQPHATSAESESETS